MWVSTATGIIDRLMEKAQKFYDQAVDKWERLAERAGKAVTSPQGERITNAPSFMQGVDRPGAPGLRRRAHLPESDGPCPPTWGQEVPTGDELVRNGPGFRLGRC